MKLAFATFLLLLIQIQNGLAAYSKWLCVMEDPRLNNGVGPLTDGIPTFAADSQFLTSIGQLSRIQQDVEPHLCSSD